MVVDIFNSQLALYTKLPGVWCLTHVGREGTAEFPDRQFSDKPQIGFVAQEVLQWLPEVVAKGSDGYYSVDYGRFAPVLVQAVQELREQKDSEITALKTDNAEMRKRLEKLEAVMLGSRSNEQASNRGVNVTVGDRAGLELK